MGLLCPNILSKEYIDLALVFTGEARTSPN